MDKFAIFVLFDERSKRDNSASPGRVSEDNLIAYESHDHQEVLLRLSKVSDEG